MARVISYPSMQVYSPGMLSSTSFGVQYDASRSSNGYSHRNGQYLTVPGAPSTTSPAPSPNLSVYSSAQKSSVSTYASPLLDEATRSRLLQLYTTKKPIKDPKQVQSHLTCLYLTRHNVKDVIASSMQDQTSKLSQTMPEASFSHSLLKLLSQSWKVTFGTIDFLELVWTGRRPNRRWADVLSACSCSEDGSDSTPCPLSDDQDEYLALNLAVTYYYTPEGQPVISLAAIAITQEAYGVIRQHLQTQHQLGLSPHSASELANTLDFDAIPFINRDLLVPTLCRWRNADVQTILTMAAEGRAWTGKLLPSENDSLSSDAMDVDSNRRQDQEVEVDGAWFFPTAKVDGSSQSGSGSDTSSSCTTIDSGSDDINLKDENMVQQEQEREREESPPPSYELRAALVPGRNIVFRTLAARLSRTMDPAWIRRSSQFEKDDRLTIKSIRKHGIKRRRAA